MPILGAPRMIHWVAEKIAEEVERQELDEDKLQGQLLDLQMRYELGEMDDEQYTTEEKALLDRLSLIRKVKERG
ncbi:MAG: gas vesicle protein GvpG [Chloroflexota bacterium]|nr:gas vesicle protein GvpG [Chloroflexota bacterium]